MLNGDILRDAMISAAHNISNHRTSVDELNVFPVPDGDTGTNMSMSMQGALREMKKVSGQTAGEVAKLTASALLRSARGNSGVITSLIFRGFQKGLKDCDVLTARAVADCFKSGSDCAYNAVMKPTEGTILTVIRTAGEYAEKSLESTDDAVTVFGEALNGARTALAQTPEILPVLKKAGVVDAGGQGLVYILEGMYSVLKDGVIIASENSDEPAYQKESGSAVSEIDVDTKFPYCTEFIVNKSENCENASVLREYLESIGDCVVAVDDDSIIKVHVHTDHPGNAIEKALTFGTLVNLKIENMLDQHERAKHDEKNENFGKSAPAVQKGEITSVPIEKPYGFVAVCAGSGFEDLFKQLGVDTVVSGGQTMNPSTSDILAAIEQTPAETVFVLPNNKNIIMAAEQTIEISTRKVIVLHTRTVPEGIRAMISFDPDADAEQNAITMKNEYSTVTTGQITFAARNSSVDGKKITKGDLLCMINGKIVFTETDLEKATLKLVKQMINKDTSFVTLYNGCDIESSDVTAIFDAVNEKYSQKVDVALVDGGQPIYYFVISAE